MFNLALYCKKVTFQIKMFHIKLLIVSKNCLSSFFTFKLLLCMLKYVKHGAKNILIVVRERPLDGALVLWVLLSCVFGSFVLPYGS